MSLTAIKVEKVVCGTNWESNLKSAVQRVKLLGYEFSINVQSLNTLCMNPFVKLSHDDIEAPAAPARDR